MKRIPLRPEAWLPWLTVFGFGCYIVSWAGREAFYEAFNVSSETVGVNYPMILIPAAVIGAFIVLLLTAITTLLLPLFMRISRRAARWQMKVGGLIMLGTFLGGLIIIAAFRLNPEHAVTVTVSVLFWFGGLLAAHGMSASADRAWRRCRVFWLRQRASSPEQARETTIAYLKARRTRRQQRAARRAERAQIRREGLPTARALLLSVAILLFITFAIYVRNAATHAASNVIDGRSDVFVGADLSAAVVLNVQARGVKVDAIAPQFRPLEKAQMLYLGSNGGAYVLYNRTARQAVLVPTGSVVLRFSG